MAFDPNLNPENLKKVNQEATRLLSALGGISSALNEAAKNSAKISGDTLDTFKSSQTQAEKLAKKLQGLTKDQLKGLSLEKTFKSDLIKLDAESAARAAKIATLQENINTLYEIGGEEAMDEADALAESLVQLQEQNSISEEVKKQFENIHQTTREIEKVNPFKGVSEMVQEVPILRKAFDGLANAADKFNDELVEGNSTMKAMGKSLLDIKKGTGIFADIGKGIAAFGIKSAVEGFNRLDEASVTLEKSLNMNTTEAINFQKELIHTANTIQGVTAGDLNKSLIEANQALGTTAKMSSETLLTFTAMTKQMGVSADEASKLNQFSLASGQNFEQFTNEAIGSVQVLNAVNGTAIDYKGILKDVNNMSNAVKLSTQAQGKNLAEAAYQAKKMGLSMGELDNIAGGLLDFEQSIANELEAELLLGRDLNLEKARAAALDNDLVKMGEELQKQGITAAKFADMNRIEQESIAKAMGMSRDSMADMFVEQEALNALSKTAGDTLDQKLKNELKAIDNLKTQEEKEAALAALKKKVGKEELVDKLKAQTLQEKALEAQIDMADTMASAFPTEAITGMKDAMNSLAKYIPALTVAIGALTAAILLMKLGRGIAQFKQFTKSIKGARGSVDDLGKGLGKLGGTADDAAKAAANSMDDMAKTAANSADDAAKAAMNATDDVAKSMTGTLDDVAKSGSKLGGIFKPLKGILSGALDNIKNLGKGIGNAVGKASNLAKNITLAGGGATVVASSMDDVAKATASSADDAAKAAMNATDDVAKTAANSANDAAKAATNSMDNVAKAATNVTDDVAKATASSADDVAKAAMSATDNVAKTATSAADDVAKATANSVDNAAKAATSVVDDATKTMAGGLDDAAKAGSKLGEVFKSFKGLLSGALSGIKNLAKGIGEAVGKAGSLAKNLASAGGGAAGAASAMSGGAGNAAKAATSAAKGSGGAAKAATTAATKSGGGGLFGKAFDFVKGGVSKAVGGVKSVAGQAVEMGGKALDAVNPMTYVKKFFKGGSGVSKLLKKLPGVGALIGPAIAAFEISQAAGSAADPRTVGSATLNALGGLGGGALGAALGTLIPVPVVGTMLGGMAGDYIGRMVADLVSENVDMSGLGQMAINVFGGQTDTEGISPLMAEAGGTSETQIASDTASDFISRPGQPIQKFRPDDIVIGATNPMGGGSGDNARTVELLERLVAAVEKGGIINMDGNKVGTVLGMSSYRTQ